MVKYKQGTDALDVLNREDDGDKAKFSSFKSGDVHFIKVLGTSDLIQFFSYGIFGKVNSFVAANPSEKSAKGFPTDNHTPWDLAFKYHRDKSSDFNDKHGQESGKYKPKQRFAMGFYDLDSGEQIIVDVSRNQAQAIHGTVKKYKIKLGKLAFELTKEGSGTSTTVSLTPVLDFDEDLTDKQKENYSKSPGEFDMSLFDGILYEAEEDEQITLLNQAGFDVSLIGLEIPKQAEDGADKAEPADVEPAEDIQDSELPF